MARVRFNTTGKGRGEIYLDDRRIYGVNGFTLTSRVGDVDHVTLSFPMLDGSDVERDADVFVLPKVRDTLVLLGWTPPPDKAPC
jgi:hypothetical protein